ncbi:GGDEF domain-containing protein [Herminiimonas arsenitoxidans]|uniref:GGDEF domain-containing protein n=1 Tax=Herminiimonas arsenitoxidans TaxID=1809410 RepID=UPI0009713518|nr:GGDEF domain-containing protein [Herminiimonas arsenitoxidans]
MQDKRDNPSQNPAEIAREAFRQLAVRRIAPTPDAYRAIYDEIAGYAMEPTAEEVLAEFATTLLNAPDGVAIIGKTLQEAATTPYWPDYSKGLTQLVKHYQTQLSAQSSTNTSTAPTVVNTTMSLIDDPQPLMLRDLLTRTLSLAVASLLQGAPALAEEAEALGRSIKDAQTESALNEVSARLKQLCFKIELQSGDMAEQQELLLRVFRLLLENISNLLEQDSWMQGQIEAVRNLISAPINDVALNEVMRSLKEVIYKQGTLKHSLVDAKTSVKNMVNTFIDRLADIANTTGNYHQQIDRYSKEITQTADITKLNKILDEVKRETRIAQTEALRSRDIIIAARKDVEDAEARIHNLELQLEQMSELVREDQLTGSLNRRGLDDVLEREMARADRRASPLCIAMLDLDDFKKINDKYGHTAGDEALIHLVRVIKETLRSMDMIARFGGEEFLIVLPDTSMEEAIQTITRLQRELTKQIFMHNHTRLLMTFSAGVALRNEKEDQPSMIKRADAALYKAKKAGKNRVIAAN